MPDPIPAPAVSSLTTTTVGTALPVMKSEPAIVEKAMEQSPAPATHSAVVMAAHLMTFSITCVILYFGQVVFVPLALALLFTFMLNPTVKILQRWALPRAWAVVLVVSLAFAIIVGGGYFIAMQISSLAKELPQHQRNITRKVQSIQEYFKGGTVADIQSTMATVAVEIETKAKADQLAEEKFRAEVAKIAGQSERALSHVHMAQVYSGWGAAAGIHETVRQVAVEADKTIREKHLEEASAKIALEKITQTSLPPATMEGQIGPVKPEATLTAPPPTAAKSASAAILAKPPAPVPVYITSPDKLVDLGSFSSFMPAVDALTVAGLVLVLVIMILLRWEDMRNRLISLMDRRALSVATKAFNDAGHRITKYLVMQFCLNTATGIVIWIGLWIIGVQHAALWGICAAIFRYVPYAGPAISALLPISFSIITSQGWAQPLWVIGFILTLELINNNLVEPVVFGSRLGLSEIGIIMAAVAWTFLWGAVGLVMATPLTVCLVVLGEYIPAFSLFPRLLSDKPVLEPHYSLYQRLLSHDDMESKAIIHQSVVKDGTETTINDLLVPALSLAQSDSDASMLTETDEEFIRDNMPKFLDLALEKVGKSNPPKDAEIASLEEEPGRAKEAVDISQQGLAIVWPMNALSAAAAGMLDLLMPDGSLPLHIIPSNSLTSSLADLQAKKKTAALCLLGLNENDVSRIRKITKRLRASSTLPILVSLPNLKPATREAVQAELRVVGVSAFSKSLPETAVALQSYLRATA